jgi:hypothetical protein
MLAVAPFKFKVPPNTVVKIAVPPTVTLPPFTNAEDSEPVAVT